MVRRTFLIEFIVRHVKKSLKNLILTIFFIEGILPERFFQSNGNIENFSLSSNNWSQFPSHYFQHLSKLKAVDLSRNQLTGLPNNLSHQLTHLNLSFNNVSNLPKGTFQNLTEIIFLDLSGNSIEVIPETLFASNPNLETIVWEKDDCHRLSNSSRMFPHHLFDSNIHLTSFSYSTRIRNKSSTCQKVTFQKNLFKNQDLSLKRLKITETLLDWNDLGNCFDN
jgi:Leucine-rich repeat (LRR) protein